MVATEMPDGVRFWKVGGRGIPRDFTLLSLKDAYLSGWGGMRGDSTENNWELLHDSLENPYLYGELFGATSLALTGGPAGHDASPT